MHAFSAAKRTILLIAGLALFGLAFSAQAEKEDGYLGVMLQDISPSMAKALQMDQDSGVMINGVVEDSPAEKAGLEDGDVILEFNGKSIEDYGDLTKSVRKTEPGEQVNVVVLRDGKKKTIEVEVGENDNEWTFFDSDHHMEWVGDDDNTFAIAPHGGHSSVWISEDGDDFLFNSDRGYMGIHLDDLGEQMGEYFGVEDGEGALITEVVEDSPAAAAGLKAGDVIVKIGDEDIESAGDVHEALAETEADQEVQVQVIRKGSGKNLKVTLGELPESDLDEHIKIITRNVKAPHMMKHFAPHGDMDVRVMRHGAPDVEVLEFRNEAEQELGEMREELDKMRAELDALRQELKK